MPDTKPEDQITPTQLQEQISNLTKLVETQKTELAQKSKSELNKAASDASAKADVDAKKLQDEADIRNMLTKETDIDVDALSNKEVLDIVATAFDSAFDAKAKMASTELSRPIEELNGKMDNIQKYLLQREAASGIEGARSKFSDFDTYKEDIGKIFDTYPGIAVEDAYILAKGHKVGDSPNQKEVETEKPASLGTRAQAAEDAYAETKKENKKVINPSSRKGFKAFLDKAVEKTMGNKTY